MFLTILGAISVVVGIAALLAVTMWKSSAAKRNQKWLLSGAGVFLLVGLILLIQGGGVGNVDTTMEPVSTASGSAASAPDFSAKQPATVEYLQDFMTYMDTYYKRLRGAVYQVNPTDEIWLNMVRGSNVEGEKRNAKIAYETQSGVEPEDIYNKRTEVTHAWEMIERLSVEYDLYRLGQSSKDNVHKHEQAFEEQYEKVQSMLK